MFAQATKPDAPPDAPQYTTHFARSPVDLAARPKGRLTWRQITQFRDDGYLIIDSHVPTQLLDQVRREMESCYPRSASGEPGRMMDAWRVNPGVKDLALAPSVLAVLKDLYGREPLPFQTDNFPVGTELAPHADNIGSNSIPAGWKCAAWVALEDADLQNGPVVLYPGSHRLPEYTLADCGVPAIPDTYAQYHKHYEPFIREIIRKQGLKPLPALVKKGQVIIWASNLIHGGAERRDRSRSRHSQLTSYFFPGCRYYTPLYSEPDRICWRTPTWITNGPDTISWKDVGEEDRATLETVGLVARARSVLAQDNLSVFFGHLRSPGLFSGDDVMLPQFIESARGCEVVDTAGRTYIDWSLGGGAMLLGYRRPEVEEAIREQLAAGPLLPMMHRVQVEVAATLRDMIPCAEMVAFGKNGSDAVTAAVRIARAATGRTLILYSGYHGFHDWYFANFPAVRGIPTALGPTLAPFPYNDIGALEKMLEEHRDAVAAVLLDPVMYELPRPGYLEAIREVAHRHGALLIFDEVVTGFRFGTGGAQQLYGVTPDLASIGKALANGMPVSAVVGRRALLEQLSHCGFGMTFQCETLSLAAAKATLAVLRREPVAEAVARAGERLRAGFEHECARLGIRGSLTGHPSRLLITFEPHGPFHPAYLLHLFLTELRARGVISAGLFLGSSAHDEEAVERTMGAVRAALGAVAGLIASGRFESWDLPRRPRAEGYVDSVIANDKGVAVSGWLFLDGRPADAIDFLGVSGRGVRATRVARPDVGQARAEYERGGEGGFTAFLPREPTILHATTGGASLRCVLLPGAGAAPPAPLHTGQPVRI
jgi:glutamate-1-semialdehyde 2,1-aminomutase